MCIAQTLLTFRKFGRDIKLDGNRTKGVHGNKEIGLVLDPTTGSMSFTGLETESAMSYDSFMSHPIRMFIY